MFAKTRLALLSALLFASLLAASCTPTPGPGSPTPTSSPEPGLNNGPIQFNQVSLQVASATVDSAFPAGCQDLPPACTRARDGFRYLTVVFTAANLAEGEMLAYKDIPADVNVQSAAADKYPAAFRSYEVANRVLTLGFEVPADFTGFVLHWPGNPPKDVAPAIAPAPGSAPQVTPSAAPRPAGGAAVLITRCQVSGFETYLDPAGRFCFAYPGRFTRGPDGGLSGPSLDNSLQAARVSLAIDVQVSPAGSSLAQIADKYLAQYTGLAGAPEIKRTTLPLSGQPAEVAEPVPGLGSSRLIFCLHGSSLYTVTFHPVDIASGQTDLADLYQAFIATFTFLP